MIANSSQLVDASIISRSISHAEGSYTTLATQNYGWWEEQAPWSVFLPFHFFPGDPDYGGAGRMDGRRNHWSCTPNSTGVKELLKRALKSRSLYRVGIGLHTFSDSWAHQNFSGKLEDWNAVDESSLIPNIGHAQLLTLPDETDAEWEDPRLNGENRSIRNGERFMESARKIYRYLCTYMGRSFDDETFVMDELAELLGFPGFPRGREERVLDLIIAGDVERYDRKRWWQEAVFLDGGEDEELFGGYSKLLWLREAVRSYTAQGGSRREESLTARENFLSSHLNRWNEAAREHLREAHEILSYRG